MRKLRRAAGLLAAASLAWTFTQLWGRLQSAFGSPRPAPAQGPAAAPKDQAAPRPADTVRQKKDCVVFITCNGIYE